MIRINMLQAVRLHGARKCAPDFLNGTKPQAYPNGVGAMIIHARRIVADGWFHRAKQPASRTKPQGHLLATS